MKPQVKYDPTITSGTMETNQASIEMTAEMFDLLSSGVYKDKILAVIRETICNARDSQVAAKSSKSIVLHVPSRFSPYLSIRDYGTGLSEAAIMELYLKYGYSNKRDSNEGIGGFGIGSKSPLAYTESFIVTSFFEGVKSSYSVYKENGIPQVSKIFSGDTTEGNGLEVKVPVNQQDVEVFKQKATNFLQYFDYPVEHNLTNFTKPVARVTTPEYDLYTDNSGYSRHRKVLAVMGGVAYEVSDELSRSIIDVVGKDIVVFKFNIGDLAVAASRETLSETKETQLFIKNAIDNLNSTIVDESIDNAVKNSTCVNEFVNYLTESRVIYYAAGGGTSSKGYHNNYKSRVIAFKGQSLDDINNKFDINLRGIKHSKEVIEGLRYVRKGSSFLILDRSTSFMKVARKLASSTGNSTYLIVADQTKLIKEWFGDDIQVHSTETLYHKYFPKGATNVSVASSGLFDSTGGEVSNLKTDQEGIYLTFNGQTLCDETGKFTDEYPSSHNNFTDLIKVIRSAKKLNSDIKLPEIYFCRRGGLPAVRKTKLKHVGLKDLVSLIEKGLNLNVKEEALRYILKADMNGVRLDDDVLRFIINEGLVKCKIDKKFVDLIKLDSNNTTTFQLSHQYELYNLIRNTYKDEIAGAIKLFKEAIDTIKEEYPLLTMFLGQQNYYLRVLKFDYKKEIRGYMNTRTKLKGEYV